MSSPVSLSFDLGKASYQSSLCSQSNCMARKASSFSQAEFFVACTALIWLKACEEEYNIPYKNSAHLPFGKEKLLPSLMYEWAGTQSPTCKHRGCVGPQVVQRVCEWHHATTLKHSIFSVLWGSIHHTSNVGNYMRETSWVVFPLALTLQLSSSSCLCYLLASAHPLPTNLPVVLLSTMPQPSAGIKPWDLVMGFCWAPTMPSPFANAACKEEGRCYPNAWVEVSCTKILWRSC